MFDGDSMVVDARRARCWPARRSSSSTCWCWTWTCRPVSGHRSGDVLGFDVRRVTLGDRPLPAYPAAARAAGRAAAAGAG